MVTLSAQTTLGYAFDHWEGDLSGAGNPASLTMDFGKTVNAILAALTQYTLTATVDPESFGSVTIEPTGGVYYDGSSVVTVRERDVCIGGSYDEGSHCVPGYWKNGVWNELTPAVSGRQAEVRAVAVRDGVVYAGSYCYSSADHSIPGYWEDGVWTPLPSTAEGGDGSVESIVVCGTDIYAAGTVKHTTASQDLGALWENGVPTTYALGADSASGRDLAVSGSDVYVASDAYAGSLYYAGDWENGTWSPLDPLVDGYGASAIRNENEPYGTFPCIWRNGVRTELES